MNNEWREIVLNEIVEHTKGFAFKSKDFTSQGIPIVKVKDFTSNSIDLSSCNFINPKHSSLYVKYKLRRNDVVIATVGSWPNNPNSVVGKTVKVPREVENALLNQNAVILRVNNLSNQTFLFYLLKNDDFKNYIISTAQGSANQASISLNDIYNYKFNLPPLPEQKAIAQILGSLDDKIELNRKMNETLEAMAQSLFQSLFVDFDPVLDNALAAGNTIPEELQVKAEKRKRVQAHLKLSNTNPSLSALFPNSFVFNTTLNKWIPEGWEVKIISDLTEVISKGTTPRSEDVDGKINSIPFLKVRDISSSGDISEELDMIPEEIHYDSLKRSILKESDIIISIAGTIGRVTIIPNHLNNSNCNQALAFIRLINKDLYNNFIYQLLITEQLQSTISSKVVQAVQANISLKTLSELQFTIPNEPVLKNWNIQQNKIARKVSLNKIQISKLTQLRDTLLPQLISGKLRVPEAMLQIEKLTSA
jgi:type I restriction enzyme S subunit